MGQGPWSVVRGVVAQRGLLCRSEVVLGVDEQQRPVARRVEAEVRAAERLDEPAALPRAQTSARVRVRVRVHVHVHVHVHMCVCVCSPWPECTYYEY